MNFDKTVETCMSIAAYSISALGVAAVIASIAAIYNAATTTGEVDYCYVDSRSPTGMAPQFLLFGHRPWRSDHNLGSYATVAEAKASADVLQCRIRMSK